MSLDRTITNGVEAAFEAAGDLKETITLTSEAVEAYDHINQTPIKGAPDTNSCEAIQTQRNRGEDGTEEVTYLVRYADVPFYSYQKMTTKYGDYSITSFEPTMEFIVEIHGVKENQIEQV